MAAAETNGVDGPRSGADPEELGLRALVWTLADPRLAMRLIAVTGIDPRDLRTRLREPAVLAEYLFRDNSFPFGSFLMTGTGIVPPDSFTLKAGDRISITIPPIGTLMNEVAPRS